VVAVHAKEMTGWSSVVHFYQVLTFIFFAGFVIYMVLYFGLADSDANRDYPPSGSTDCLFKLVYPMVVKNPYNNPYSMTLDHSTGAMMLVSFSLGQSAELNPINAIYNLTSGGNATFVELVAPGVAFNSSLTRSVPQTVVSDKLDLLTNGTYFWNLATKSSFMLDTFNPPDGMVMGSVQEWTNGFVVQWITPSATSAAGSQSRLGVYQLVGSTWYGSSLNPLSAVTANLGQFGLNRIWVNGPSIVWGTGSSIVVYDYSPSSITWSQTTSSTDLISATTDCLAYVLTSVGLQVYVLDSTYVVKQLQRLFTNPAQELAARQFYTVDTYTTSIKRNSSQYVMRATEFALIIGDGSRYVTHYRKFGHGGKLQPNPTIIDLGQVDPTVYQWSLIDVNILQGTNTQFLVVPYNSSDNPPDEVQDGQVGFFHDACFE